VIDPTITTARPSKPDLYTLAEMGRVAREAAEVFAIREWVARLATQAKPRDYVGMLRELYGDIIRRWRYVPESDEWIHGNPDSLIRFVLGTRYNGGDTNPSAAPLPPVGEPGWGDCDDISTVVAAAVLAMGHTPYFRVARGNIGAHVSVLARTPRGELVSIDPVGHPDHPFGWQLPANHVQIFDLDGRPANPDDPNSFGGIHVSTYFSGVDGTPNAKTLTQWVAVPAGDQGGPRSLAVPERALRLFRSGASIDGCPAVDERGITYMYSQPDDLWLDERLWQTQLGRKPAALGGVADRHRRRATRRRRRTKRRRVIRRVAGRARDIVGRVASNPLVQSVASTALRTVGVPGVVTRGAMTAAGRLARGQGRGLIHRGAQAVARRAKRNLASRSPMSAGEGVESRTPMVVEQGGRAFLAQPVCCMSGISGFYELGALDITSAPTPGHWYRIQKGDTLLTVAQKAYGSRKDRYKHSKWINNATSNAHAFDPGATDNLFPNGRITFMPRFSDDPEAAIRGESGRAFAVIWIPAAEGDEAPPVAEPPDEVVPEDEPDDVEPPQDDTPDLPPEESETPDEPDVVTPPEDPQDVEPPVAPEDPEAAAQAACEATGGHWGTIPGFGPQCIRCGPTENWDPSLEKCIPEGPPPGWPSVEPDTGVIIPPADPQIIPPSSTTPQVGPGWPVPPGPQQGDGSLLNNPIVRAIGAWLLLKQLS